MCVLGVFSVWKRKKTCREAGEKGEFQRGKKKKEEKVLPVCGVPGAIYSLGRVFRGGGPSRATGLKRPQNEWIMTPLERS